jgi:monovalent cation/hydrogen antiporter
VLQGLTLAPLLRWFRLADDGAVARELATARSLIEQTAVEALRRSGSPQAPALIGELEQAWMTPDRQHLALRMIGLQRSRLLELRRQAVIGDDAFHLLEEELDWAEGHTNRRLRRD